MSRPIINTEECIACGVCENECISKVIFVDDNCAKVVNPENCIACSECMDYCPMGAITEIVDDD